MGFELILGDFREGLRQWGFLLNWVLFGSMGNSVMRYPNKAHLEAWNSKATICKEVSHSY